MAGSKRLPQKAELPWFWNGFGIKSSKAEKRDERQKWLTAVSFLLLWAIFRYDWQCLSYFLPLKSTSFLANTQFLPPNLSLLASAQMLESSYFLRVQRRQCVCTTIFHQSNLPKATWAKGPAAHRPGDSAGAEQAPARSALPRRCSSSNFHVC